MPHRYWDLMGEYDAETESYTPFAGAHGASPYRPSAKGRLIGLRAVANREAATSLINGLAFKLTCTIWKPNALVVGCVGSGLQTAPALQAPYFDFDVDQPVDTGVDITLEGKNCTSDTPVTVSALLFGCFEAA